MISPLSSTSYGKDPEDCYFILLLRPESNKGC